MSRTPQQEIGEALQCDGHAEVVLRRSPNEGQIVAKVPNGEEIIILQRDGEHLKVRWNQIEAWAKANNVQQRHLPPTCAQVPSSVRQQALCVALQCDGHAEVVLRRSPNEGQIVAKVPNGEEMIILQRDGEYLKVRWNQIEAWAKANNVQQQHLPPTLARVPTPARQQALGVALQCDGHAEVVLRRSPNEGQIVAKVPNGEEVIILRRDGEHLKVRWNQIEAWAKANNVQQRHLPPTCAQVPSPAPQLCEIPLASPAECALVRLEASPASPADLALQQFEIPLAPRVDAAEILVIGTGVMGSRVAAWLLLLGERVRIWTTTSRNLHTEQLACASALSEVQAALDGENDHGFSISAATAASIVSEGDSDLLAALPFRRIGRHLKVKEELWSRLTIQANDGRPSRQDCRSASNVWLAIDCTRDPGPSPHEQSEAAQRSAKKFAKVIEDSPGAVLAIKHEGLDFRTVQAACNPQLPVILLRFLKPVFFMPFVEMQGAHDASLACVSNWLEKHNLMPFTSATRVRMMDGPHVDGAARRLMRTYAMQHFTGVVAENDVCCVCLVDPAEVVNGTCGHAVFCASCVADYSRAGHRRCPLCRAPWRLDMALHLVIR